MKKIKLIRPIKDVTGENELNEVSIKEENEITAYDLYDVEFDSGGKIKFGTMAPAIANMCNLTEGQVATMSPKDFAKLSAEVGKYIE